MVEVPLPNGQTALVDDADSALIQDYRWHMKTGSGYVIANVRKFHPSPGRQTECSGRWTVIYLHCLIMGVREGYEIDHINRNKLDNRRANLRFVPHWVNLQNVGLSKRNTSGYRGVYLNKKAHPDRPWVAYSLINRKRITIGGFATAAAASAAVEAARIKHLREAGFDP